MFAVLLKNYCYLYNSSITLPGLEAYLTAISPFFPNILQIAGTHSDMLLVFKKWDKFVKNNCEKYLLLNLNEALEHASFFLSSSFFMAEKIAALKDTENQRNTFDWDILGFLRLNRPPSMLKNPYVKIIGMDL
jgi:hypothetical protein